MIRIPFFVFASSVFLMACQSQNESAVIGAVYNEEVMNALRKPQESYNKKRTPIIFDAGTTAQTCGEYLHLIAGEVIKEDVNNQMVKSEYLLCDMLAIVGDKKPDAGRQGVTFGQTLAMRLDLRSFPSSLSQMLDEQKHSLNQLDEKAVKAESTAVIYETADWHYRLELVATLDVNNNGKADWVLWLADEAKSGNYRQYQTLIAYDVRVTDLISAVPYVATMGAQPK